MKSLKKLIIIGLALVVFLGTLGLENAFAGPAAVQLRGHLSVVVPENQTVQITDNNTPQTLTGGEQDLKAGDTVDAKSATGAEIHFSDHGVVRLAQNSLVNVDALDAQNDAFVLNLQQGRAWINNMYTSATLNLIANGVDVIPDFAAVDVNIKDAQTVVYANRHQVSVGIVPLDYKGTSAKLFPDDDFINSFPLPEGNQVTVNTDTITQNESTLRKLFYSKLIKEFPVGNIDPQMLSSDQWLQTNIQSDKTYELALANSSAQDIRNRGLKVDDVDSFGYTFGQSLEHFYNVLTFSQSKVIARLNNDIFDQFDDAKYLLIFGQTTRAQERLDLFKKSLDAALASHDAAYKTQVLLQLEQEYDDLAYVTPDNTLAPAKTMVNAYLLAQLGDTQNAIEQKFLLIRNTMNGVYDLADQNSQLARQALQDYFNEFTQVVTQEQTRLNGLSNILAEENQIMDNLLMQYPMFYQDTFFAMKNQLEQDWLALVPESAEKNDEEQSIISTKIDFLHQLQTFFLADKINVDDAKQIVFRLFHEADVLQLPADQQVAVNDLYDMRLQNFGVFYNYLNSPEYVATTLHGSARNDQFNQFVQAQQQQVSIDQIRQEILGNDTQQTVTPDQIVAQAQEDFSGIGATNVTFGTFTDITQKLIPVTSATVGGTTIQAQYDWSNKLVSQIFTGNTLLSSSPVNLSNLALLIQTQTQSQQAAPTTPVVPAQPATSPADSTTQRVAKILLIQKLKGFDITTTESNITIDDLSSSQFTIASASLVSDPTMIFSFDVDGQSNAVTNLVVQSASGGNPVNGALNLSDVSGQVKVAAESGK